MPLHPGRAPAQQAAEEGEAHGVADGARAASLRSADGGAVVLVDQDQAAAALGAERVGRALERADAGVAAREGGGGRSSGRSRRRNTLGPRKRWASLSSLRTASF